MVDESHEKNRIRSTASQTYQAPTSAAPFDLGLALWNQRHAAASVSERLSQFFETLLTLQNPPVFLPEDYAKVFSIALEFQPDIIVEFGRMYGNSTCALTEAACHLPRTKVVSACLSRAWFQKTLPSIQHLIDPRWLERLDARVVNFFDLDVKSLLAEKERILFVLDAHGWDVAEYFLGEVLPCMKNKHHIVLVHDIVLPDSFSQVHDRWFPEPQPHKMRSYQGRGIWKSNFDDQGTMQYLFANNLAGGYGEFVALIDFTLRNRVTLHSLEASVRQTMDLIPEMQQELELLLGPTMCSPLSAYAWMTLNGTGESELEFPVFTRPKDNVPQGAEVLADLQRYNVRRKPTPLTFALLVAKSLMGRYRT